MKVPAEDGIEIDSPGQIKFKNAEGVVVAGIKRSADGIVITDGGTGAGTISGINKIVSGPAPDRYALTMELTGGTANVRAEGEGANTNPTIHMIGGEVHLGITDYNDNVVGLTREAADDFNLAPCDGLGVGTVDLGLAARRFRHVRLSGEVKSSSGVGAKNGATVVADEAGDGIVHRTVLTLTETPITLTDYAGDGQAGGVKLYDFPAGDIHIMGAVIDADITLVGAQWVDTAQGDVGLGSVTKGDGTALVTAEQDIIATTEIAALVAQAGPINAQSVAAKTEAKAGGTDLDLFLNVRIDDDAAHITATGTVTGTVTITWINLGDF